MKQPIQVGERVVIYGHSEIDCRVKEVTYVPDEARWHIVVHWGEMGVSRIYDTDERKTWYRYTSAN